MNRMPIFVTLKLRSYCENIAANNKKPKKMYTHTRGSVEKKTTADL